MKSIQQYKTLAALSAPGLDEAVAQHLDFGWQPWGAPYLAAVDGAGYIHQVVVRSDSEDGTYTSDDVVKMASLVMKACFDLQGVRDLTVQGD